VNCSTEPTVGLSSEEVVQHVSRMSKVAPDGAYVKDRISLDIKCVFEALDVRRKLIEMDNFVNFLVRVYPK